MGESSTVSSLTTRTIVTGASGNDEAPNGGLANQTRLALTSVNPMFELEQALFAVGAHVVGNRRSSARNRLLEHFLQRPIQSPKLHPAKRRCPAPGSNGGTEQRFVGINIAHTAEKLLIQESTLNGCLATSKEIH